MPALPEIATTVATFLGALVALGACAALLAATVEVARKPSLRDALGADSVPPALFALGLLVYASIALLLAAGVLVLIGTVIGLPFIDAPPDRDPGETFLFYVLRLAGLTTVLGAVIALPFTIIRLRLNQEQTANAQESLFNDKINAATQGLYARRQVTKAVVPGGSYHHHQDFWEDDIVQRCAAIDRLEGLAEENRIEVPRIARLLSVYVRELSREIPPKEPPGDATPEALREWAWSLPKPRSDMEKAAQTLGRLRALAETPLDNGEIDLRGANLQRVAFSGLDFEKAIMNDARLQGANLLEAQLQGANLAGAQLQGANLTRAQLQGADLTWAQLQRAHLVGAQLQGADLAGAQLQGAHLVRAQLQGAHLVVAQLQGADLTVAQFDHATDLTAAALRGAAVRSIDFIGIPQIARFLDEIYGDASVQIPSNARPGDEGWPKHWADTQLEWEEFTEAWRAWKANLPPG